MKISTTKLSLFGVKLKKMPLWLRHKCQAVASAGKLLAITFTFHVCVLCVVPSQLSHFQYFQKIFTLLSQKRCLFALSQVSGPCQCRQTTGTFTFYICVLYRNHLTFTFWREKRMQSSSSAHKCQAYASAGKLLPLSISLSTFSTN